MSEGSMVGGALAKGVSFPVLLWSGCAREGADRTSLDEAGGRRQPYARARTRGVRKIGPGEVSSREGGRGPRYRFTKSQRRSSEPEASKA